MEKLCKRQKFIMHEVIRITFIEKLIFAIVCKKMYTKALSALAIICLTPCFADLSCECVCVCVCACVCVYLCTYDFEYYCIF